MRVVEVTELTGPEAVRLGERPEPGGDGVRVAVRAIAMTMTVAIAALQAVRGIVGIVTRLPAGHREPFNLRMIGMMMMIGCKLAIAVSY